MKLADAQLRIADLELENGLLRTVLRSACRCHEPDVNPPTDWKTRARIPHHCDCPLYVIDLPDAVTAPAAHADATVRRAALIAGL